MTLKIAPNKFSLAPVYVGGSFGSKHILSKVITVAGILSKATGRPVKFMEDRIDSLAACDSHASDRFYESELAVAKDGRFLSLRIDVVDDYGAYFQFGQTSHGNYLAQVTGPYRIPSVEITLKAVLTNKCQQMVYRGAGSEVNNWMLERLVDEAARELGMEPAEIRRRNFIQPQEFPYRIPTGNIYDSGNYPGVLEKALTLAEYDRWRKEQERLRREGRSIGIGLATCQQRSVYSATEFWFWYEQPAFPLTTTPESVTLRVGPTGHFVVSLSSPFWGNSPETVVSQALAEEFGIDPTEVTVLYEDSLRAMPAVGPGGSRMTVMLAGAVRGASQKLKGKMLKIAAHLMEAGAEDMVLEEGKAYVKGYPEKFMTIPDIAFKAHFFKLDLPEEIETGLEAGHTYDHPYATKPSDDRSDLGAFYPIMAHAAHIPVVEVDIETGAIKFLNYAAVHDCGTMMNPASLEGQIAGGIAQGIGTALYEELVYDEHGQFRTSTFMDYLIPTAMEVPKILIGHQETPSPFTAYGVKGSGEGGRMVAPAAVASAVEDALAPFGVKVDELPITPQKIVRWLKEAQAKT